MEKLEVFKGTELSFTLPSNDQITIREQSAADDDVLSAATRGSTVIDTINNFVMGIVTEYRGKKGITKDEVLSMKLRDKHFILLKTRMHSIGPIVEFDHKCDSCGQESHWEEDLTQYDADFSSPVETHGPKAPKPYEPDSGPQFEIELSSGKRFRLYYLNGRGEKKILQAMKNGTLSKNVELFSRDIHIEVQGEWTPISSVNILSKREGVELSKAVAEKDAQFLLGSDVVCPNCNHQEFLPFTTISDFFFPVGI